MITSLNAKTLAPSEYDISGVLDITEVGGVVYYATATGVYFFASNSTENVTSTMETGKIAFGDNSPKRFPHLEVTCNVSDASLTGYMDIAGTDIALADSTRHTAEVRGYRMPNIKVPYLQLKFVGVDATPYILSDFVVLTLDTLVKK
jgi:hypothetical protein